MLKKLLANERIKEILRFGLTGGLCFLLDYGTMLLCKEVFGLHYLVATGAGFVVSVIVNYILCIKWVFSGAKEGGFKVQALFLLTSLIGLGLNQLIMWGLVDGLHIFYAIAKIITTAIVMVYNYFTKRWTLKQ